VLTKPLSSVNQNILQHLLIYLWWYLIFNIFNFKIF